VLATALTSRRLADPKGRVAFFWRLTPRRRRLNSAPAACCCFLDFAGMFRLSASRLALLVRVFSHYTMNPKATIKRLRKQIPTFECIPGCTDCCGPVHAAPWEESQIEKHTGKAAKLNRLPSPGLCLRCPYSLNGNCEIYDDRPIICRLFGTIDEPEMLCPHGRRPKVLLTKKQGAKITEEWMKTF